MPRVILQTNLSADKVTAKFCDDLVEKLAEVLEFPSKNIGLAIHTGIYLRFANNYQDPQVHIDISHVVLKAWRIAEYGKRVTDFVAKELNVDVNNIMIWFTQPEGDSVILGGATISDKIRAEGN